LELKHFRRQVMVHEVLRADEIEGWHGEIRDGHVIDAEEDEDKADDDTDQAELSDEDEEADDEELADDEMSEEDEESEDEDEDEEEDVPRRQRRRPTGKAVRGGAR
jgi:hypothetical protein